MEKGLTVAGQPCSIDLYGPRVVLVVLKRVPLYLRDENLVRALNKFGKVLKLDDITFEDRKGRGTLRTGNKKARMEMGEKTPVPNFLRVMDALIQCEYPGVKRVCRRCKREGHFKSSCKVPFCERCSTFGHTVEECGSRCSKCRTKHAPGACPGRVSYVAVTGAGFPALPPAQKHVEPTNQPASEAASHLRGWSPGSPAAVEASASTTTTTESSVTGGLPVTTTASLASVADATTVTTTTSSVPVAEPRFQDVLSTGVFTEPETDPNVSETPTPSAASIVDFQMNEDSGLKNDDVGEVTAQQKKRMRVTAPDFRDLFGSDSEEM